jgi:N-methylhydantoinase B
MSNEQPHPELDPITLEVIRNSLPAIANEMSLDLQRSSYNMMIYEVRDYCCSLLAPNGDLLAQNLGGVSHFVADLGVIIRDGVDRYGFDGFDPGDVIITNHQRVGGQHLNNVCVYTPIFRGDALRGFAAIRAHWIDVGGLSTGFGSSLAYDPWAEGLQLDQLKLWEAGVLDEKLMRVIVDNIRYPESSTGDLRSQIASCQLGARRLEELDERYGAEIVDDATQQIFRHAEERCRQVVATIPDGVYEAETFVDGEPGDPDPVVIRVKVTVSGSDMEIDLSGCSPQRVARINGRTYAAALIAYKALTAPMEPVNEGSFAAVRVVIPEGNVMMAKFPAPMSGWSVVLPTVAETVLLALASVIPDRIPAGSAGTLGQPLVFFGTDERGRRFVSQSIEGGGWGGRPYEDGPSASVSICQGDVRNAPIESLELRVPLLIERRELVQDSAGGGRFRGGLALITEVRGLVEGRWNLNQLRRRGFPAWGLAGGRPAPLSDTFVKLPSEEEFRSVDIGQYLAPPETVVRLISSGGGGWGDPLDRDAAAVLADVTDGYVSRGAALSDYGVVIDEALRVDEAQTAAERQRRRASDYEISTAAEHNERAGGGEDRSGR